MKKHLVWLFLILLGCSNSHRDNPADPGSPGYEPRITDFRVEDGDRIVVLSEVEAVIGQLAFESPISKVLLVNLDGDNANGNELVVGLKENKTIANKGGQVLVYQYSVTEKKVVPTMTSYAPSQIPFIGAASNAFRVQNMVLLGPSYQDKEMYLLVERTDPLWFPAVLDFVNLQGETVTRYWHHGQIGALGVADLDGKGSEEIIVQGFNNATGSDVVFCLSSENIEPEKEYVSYPFPDMKISASYPNASKIAQAKERWYAFGFHMPREPIVSDYLPELPGLEVSLNTERNYFWILDAEGEIKSLFLGDVITDTSYVFSRIIGGGNQIYRRQEVIDRVQQLIHTFTDTIPR